MPRTKVPRKNAGKGNKNSEGEQAQAQAESIRHLEGLLESWKVEEALINDQCLENFDSMIQGIIRKTPDHILNMTMGEFSKKLEKSMVCKPINRTNQGSSTATSSQLSLDTGYSSAEDGAKSIASRLGRPIGPLGLSRAGKNQRGLSAQAASYIKKQSLMRSKSAVPIAHASRQKTRAKGRLQTMSADRGTILVGPKIQANTPVALLRYPHVGETVISLSGSPVIVHGNCHKGVANVNIPITNGILSLQPTAMSSLDCKFAERIGTGVLEQLRVLNNNLNMIVMQADKRN